MRFSAKLLYICAPWVIIAGLVVQQQWLSIAAAADSLGLPPFGVTLQSEPRPTPRAILGTPVPARSSGLGSVNTAISPDYVIPLDPSQSAWSVALDSDGGLQSIRFDGLSRGGNVTITVNGSAPQSVELSRVNSTAWCANSILIWAGLVSGNNQIEIAEEPGFQVVRIDGTDAWFATRTASCSSPLFQIDLGQLQSAEYPAAVYLGDSPLIWFSAKWDYYYGESFVSSVQDVVAHSGLDEASLSYTILYPERNLSMPTTLRFSAGPTADTQKIAVEQSLVATSGSATFPSNLEFLHVVLSPWYGVDWYDGTPDYFWNREQTSNAPDTLDGSYTHFSLADDNSTRRFWYPASTSDPTARARSNTHHTEFSQPMYAKNTIGGWIAKEGVGAVGLVFDTYRASFRDDLTPIQSHCGDGADTHFYLLYNTIGSLYTPFAMAAGDRVDIGYSLTTLRSVPNREQIEVLNEADLALFGTEATQRSTVVGWVGNEAAIGLKRSDGSMVIVGTGKSYTTIPVPSSTLPAVVEAYRYFDPAYPVPVAMDVSGGTIAVEPGRTTVLNAGSALVTMLPPTSTSTPSTSPTVAPSATATPTPTTSASATLTPSPTETAAATATPIAAPSASPTGTPAPTSTTGQQNSAVHMPLLLQ